MTRPTASPLDPPTQRNVTVSPTWHDISHIKFTYSLCQKNVKSRSFVTVVCSLNIVYCERYRTVQHRLMWKFNDRASNLNVLTHTGRSQWPSNLRREPTVDRLLGLRVRNPPGAWMFVCCKCCVLSGKGLCDRPITHPEESYRLWCVTECYL